MSPTLALRRGVFAALLVVVLVALLTPPAVPLDGAGDDKVVHVAVFAVLTLAGWWARLPWRWLVPGLMAYAVLTEVLQGTLTTDRHGDPADAVADVIGVLAGAGLAQIVSAARPRAQD